MSHRSVIYDWASTTSAYIKSLDSNHMVTMGDEGFGPLAGGDGSYPYTTSAGGYVWQTDLAIDTLDFGTLHLYPDSCKQNKALFLTGCRSCVADYSNRGPALQLG